MFAEDLNLKIGGEVELNCVLADYFVNSFQWIKG